MLDDDLIAIHEASHAFVAVALGLTLDYVQLGDHPCYRFVGTPRPDQRVAEILTLMAGGEAEAALLNREPIGTGSDDPKIRTLLQPGDDEYALRREVRLFVARNYPIVQRVAAALLRDGMLSGAEVERLVRGRQRLNDGVRKQGRWESLTN